MRRSTAGSTAQGLLVAPMISTHESAAVCVVTPARRKREREGQSGDNGTDAESPTSCGQVDPRGRPEGQSRRAVPKGSPDGRAHSDHTAERMYAGGEACTWLGTPAQLSYCSCRLGQKQAAVCRRHSPSQTSMKRVFIVVMCVCSSSGSDETGAGGSDETGAGGYRAATVQRRRVWPVRQRNCTPQAHAHLSAAN